jgi:superfamily I DNA/RNA helicase
MGEKVHEEGREIAMAPASSTEGQPLPLTDEQREIVEYGDGPLAVIAGAGTGKTRIIVERVRWLLETKGDLLPEQLLVLTYNVKAARELRELIQAWLGATTAVGSAPRYHSFCHGIPAESSVTHLPASGRAPMMA